LQAFIRAFSQGFFAATVPAVDGTARVGDVPGGDVLASIGRHILLVILPIFILGFLGLVYGALRDPEYTAQTRISIGQLNLTSQGVPGYASAGASLAAAYARTVDAPYVVRQTAKATTVSIAEARDALTASSIPDSPLFLVEATTTDDDRSVKMVNVASQALIEQVVQINARTDLRQQLYDKFTGAAAKTARLRIEQNEAQKRYDQDPSEKNRLALVKANAQRLSSGLRRDKLRGLYSSAAGGELADNLLQIVSPADHATSDRSSEIKTWAITGVLAGLVIGLILASVAESRLRRRETTVIAR
jgi:capsular polysaccharide biosynthesis protein